MCLLSCLRRRRRSVVIDDPQLLAADDTVEFRLGPLWDMRRARMQITDLSDGAAAPTRIEAQKLLYEQAGSMMILQCLATFKHEQRKICIKLRVGDEAIHGEREIYHQMPTAVRGLFLPVLFFCSVPMFEPNVAWSGYAMELAEFTATFLIRVDIPTPSTLRYFMHSPPHGGGQAVDIRQWRTIQDAVAVACLQLLRRLHGQGWAHGDSHAGDAICLPFLI